MRSRCSAVSVNFVITVVALPPCLPGVEMMEESEEQSDAKQSDLDLRKGNCEGESFRLDSATRPPSYPCLSKSAYFFNVIQQMNSH